jgi:hypothetical protein
VIERVGRFTVNKQRVRELQLRTILETHTGRSGNFRYFGLSSPEMKDVLDWKDILSSVVAVERGTPGEEYRDQHRLKLTAARCGIQNRLSLLHGDIDRVILDGHDDYGNVVPYPFDIVSLDYSGGLFYKDESGYMVRLRAIERLITEQAKHSHSYVLFISSSLHAIDAGEVRRSIEDLRTELNRERWNADELCDAYLDSGSDVGRLRLYVPLYVAQYGTRERVNVHTRRIVWYAGNAGIDMLNFQFALRPNLRTMCPRYPQESLSEIINRPILHVVGGRAYNTQLSLPRLRVLNPSKSNDNE